jgi:hypothetical protein
MSGSYPKVFDTSTNQWTNLLDENFTIDAIGGITSASPQADDIFRYVSASGEYINAPIATILQGKNISVNTINAGSGSVVGSLIMGSGSVSGNLSVGSTLTVGGVLITGGGGSGSVSNEQIQDGAAPLLDHAFHTNITATYDDANNRVLLSTPANPSTEDIQDVVAPLLNHAFHTNVTATYDDANNRVLLNSTAANTTEQIQDAAALLLDHAFHTRVTAVYDDVNNRVLLTSSASATISSEDIQDATAPLFDHAFHTNITATYDDANNRVLLAASLPSGTTGQTNFYDVVRDYAVVAGEANSTTKIQNALNAARDAGSGIVYIPAGTYNLQSTLRIYTGTTLYLTPRTVMFRQFADLPMLVNGDALGNYSGYSGQSNIRIIGGIWESRGQAYPVNPAMGISIGHGTDIIIQDLTISNIGGFHAIEINSSKNVRIQNCRFVGYVNTGSRGYSEAIQIDLAKSVGVFGAFGAYDNTPCEDVVIQGCYFGASGTAGTAAWATGIGTHNYTATFYHKYCKFVNNTFEGLTEYAIRTYNMYDNLLIKGNSIKNCFGGIAVGPDAPVDYADPDGPDMLLFADGHTSYNITITDNIIDNSGTTGTNGIWIIDAENVNITNNTIKGISRSGSNLADGILCVKLIHGIISNNILQNIGDDGIDVRTQSRNVLISNNVTTNVSRTTNNTFRHIYLNNDTDDCSVISNRGYRTTGNIARWGLEFLSTSNNIRYFGNYYGTSATGPVNDLSTGSSTSTVNA